MSGEYRPCDHAVTSSSPPGDEKGSLIALDDKQIVAAGGDDVAGMVVLGMQGVGGDDHVGQVQAGQQGRNCGDLVALGGYLPLGMTVWVPWRSGGRAR